MFVQLRIVVSIRERNKLMDVKFGLRFKFDGWKRQNEPFNCIVIFYTPNREKHSQAQNMHHSYVDFMAIHFTFCFVEFSKESAHININVTRIYWETPTINKK